jgi:hydroxyethylthiazole kinase-like uncharacterized protein yjeF
MHELLTPAEMGLADRLALRSGTTEMDLMERAGRAVADAAARRPLGTRILVLCGAGNNGGDGFVAARILAERGYPTRVALLGEQETLRGSAATAAQRWNRPVEAAQGASLEGAGLVIDALIGAGLSRDVDGATKALIERVNASGVPVLAVDLPSGIDGASGQVRGGAIQAAETVTFFRRKPGHVLLPGRLHCGSTRLADIGIREEVLRDIPCATFLNAPSLWLSAQPKPDAQRHKYGRGHALIVSAGIEATGAARLAARAALRIGAGLVTLASPSSALLVNASAMEAVMVRRCDGAAGLTGLLDDRRHNALVAGPGLPPDETTREIVEVALASDRAVVLDAGALTAFRTDSEMLSDASRRRAIPPVLTPHEGEFGRVFPSMLDTSKLARARAAASHARAIILLKGPDTVVAAPDGRAAIAENAPPTLATAGSGDVLAGMVGGLLAQGVPPFEAAAAAVWMHGEAARSFGVGLISEDLPGLLPRVLGELAGQ